MREKARFYQSWHDDIILKELYDLDDQQIPQNVNSNELSKTRKKIRLRAKFFKNEYFKGEDAKINQSAISRELDKLFSRTKEHESTLKPAPGNVPLIKSLIYSKNTLIQQVLLIQLHPRNLVITF